MKPHLASDWKNVLSDYIQRDQFKNLIEYVQKRSTEATVYPPLNKLFEAFNLTPFHKVKVVLLGQDPYHKKGQAHGLSFSVPKGTKLPPSLRNIYKERERDVGNNGHDLDGNLSHWAQQGVLLLNSILSVEEGKPGSHADTGWESFTDHVIEKISQHHEHCVFILWGNYAARKSKLIDKEKHLIIKAPHPSPLSAYRGFFGSSPFSQTNQYLIQNDKEPIRW